MLSAAHRHRSLVYKAKFPNPDELTAIPLCNVLVSLPRDRSKGNDLTRWSLGIRHRNMAHRPGARILQVAAAGQDRKREPVLPREKAPGESGTYSAAAQGRVNCSTARAG
jgi:hypothetical protein